MTPEEAIDRLCNGTQHAGVLTTHELARCLLALPDVGMIYQGRNEAWSPDLGDEQVQVAVRTY